MRFNHAGILGKKFFYILHPVLHQILQQTNGYNISAKYF